jgi:hypothetical protein
MSQELARTGPTGPATRRADVGIAERNEPRGLEDAGGQARRGAASPCTNLRSIYGGLRFETTDLRSARTMLDSLRSHRSASER